MERKKLGKIYLDKQIRQVKYKSRWISITFTSDFLLLAKMFVECAKPIEHLVLQVVIRQLNWFQCCNMDRANCCFKGGQQRCYTIWERKCEREDQVWFNKVYKPIFSSDSLQNTILALAKSKCCNATNFKYRWHDLLMYL